jgi:hypothetical protein
MGSKQFGMYDLPDELEKTNKTVGELQNSLAEEKKSRKKEFWINIILSAITIAIAFAALMK